MFSLLFVSSSKGKKDEEQKNKKFQYGNLGKFSLLFVSSTYYLSSPSLLLFIFTFQVWMVKKSPTTARLKCSHHFPDYVPNAFNTNNSNKNDGAFRILHFNDTNAWGRHSFNYYAKDEIVNVPPIT